MQACFLPTDILLPDAAADFEKWAVVACDQFTSQPEYWRKAAEIVGDAPSTLNLVYPEAYLAEGDARIAAIRQAMEDYMRRGVLQTRVKDGFVLVRRVTESGERLGLVGRLDLEQYDFTPGTSAPVRATEGTILSRIPPRVRIRQGASIESPHAMMLVDDAKMRLIEPLADRELPKLYDTELMLGGGHIAGYAVEGELAARTAEQIARMQAESGGFFLAVGDGNHSLATAKQCYENLKKVTPEDQWADLPARYALVEVVNNHDDALQFEPIHRVLFGVEPEQVLEAMKAAYPGAHEGEGEGHTIAYTYAGHTGTITVPNPRMQLAVGTLQTFLDAYLKEHGGEVDYIHGDEVTDELGSKSGNIGFKLPAMGKEQLFKTVMADGVLPRKTFSMGHAREKRYYLEGRTIK